MKPTDTDQQLHLLIIFTVYTNSFCVEKSFVDAPTSDGPLTYQQSGSNLHLFFRLHCNILAYARQTNRPCSTRSDDPEEMQVLHILH